MNIVPRRRPRIILRLRGVLSVMERYPVGYWRGGRRRVMVDMLIACLMLQMLRYQGSVMRNLFLGRRGPDVVVVVIVQVALPTEIGGTLVLVGLTVLQENQYLHRI